MKARMQKWPMTPFLTGRLALPTIALPSLNQLQGEGGWRVESVIWSGEVMGGFGPILLPNLESRLRARLVDEGLNWFWFSAPWLEVYKLMRVLVTF